jgi:hypothetical protein
MSDDVLDTSCGSNFESIAKELYMFSEWTLEGCGKFASNDSCTGEQLEAAVSSRKSAKAGADAPKPEIISKSTRRLASWLAD